MQPILFLDLDGTIRETVSGQTFINDPEDQKLIEGVTDVIKLYPEHIKIGITNQVVLQQVKKVCLMPLKSNGSL